MTRLRVNQSQIADFRRALLSWYGTHARVFPWRDAAVTPYVTLVAEVMLQQTQTARVAEKLPVFLESFPDVGALAAADNATIIRAWQGMGYNNRAIRLRDCARVIATQHNSIVPDSIAALRALPGIGPYTAAAIVAFAYRRDTAVMDVNIARVYSRLFRKMRTTAARKPLAFLRPLAEIIYPAGRAAEWHQAVMDLGALYCTARAPRCRTCPVAAQCRSADTMREVRPPRRSEPSFRGEPNRIWRGRVVEHLRHLPQNTSVTSKMLLERLLAGAAPAEDPSAESSWFNALLHGLQKDAIVTLSPMPASHGEQLTVRLSSGTGEKVV